jgi:hypothetical protein
MLLRASVIALAVLSPLSAFAQGEPPPAAPAGAPPAAPADAPPAAAPAPTPVVVATAPAKTWKELVTIDGLVDAYYLYNFSGGTNRTSPMGTGFQQRSFDVNSNTFTLSYAKLGIGVSSDNVGLRIDMGYGQLGNVVNGFPAGGLAAGVGGPTIGNAFLVQQAFATLTPVNNLTIDFGKFVTTAGAEVIEANKNWLYSRSILFFNIPLLHTGLRVGYKVNDMVSVQGSVVNGWNGQGFEVDNNAAKTIGLNASITLPMGVGILPTIYVGKETSTDTRFLGDLVATYAMGPLGLNLNFDFVKDTAAGIDPFIGVAIMGHYSVNEHLAATGRFEYAQQKAGTVTAKGEEVTVGVACPMAGRFEFRPEIRYDHSDPASFNAPNTPLKASQFTATGAFLAWF